MSSNITSSNVSIDIVKDSWVPSDIFTKKTFGPYPDVRTIYPKNKKVLLGEYMNPLGGANDLNICGNYVFDEEIIIMASEVLYKEDNGIQGVFRYKNESYIILSNGYTVIPVSQMYNIINEAEDYKNYLNDSMEKMNERIVQISILNEKLKNSKDHFMFHHYCDDLNDIMDIIHDSHTSMCAEINQTINTNKEYIDNIRTDINEYSDRWSNHGITNKQVYKLYNCLDSFENYIEDEDAIRQAITKYNNTVTDLDFRKLSKRFILADALGEMMRNVRVLETMIFFENDHTYYKGSDKQKIANLMKNFSDIEISFCDMMDDNIKEANETKSDEVFKYYKSRFTEVIKLLPHIVITINFTNVIYTNLFVEHGLIPEASNARLARPQNCMVCLSDNVICRFVGTCSCKVNSSGQYPDHAYLCDDCRPKISKCIICKTNLKSGTMTVYDSDSDSDSD